MMPAVPRDPSANDSEKRLELESALIEARSFLRVIELATDDRGDGLDVHDVGAINFVVGRALVMADAALDRLDGQ